MKEEKHKEKKVTGLDLKILRIRAGLKQLEVAQKVGMHPTALSLIENGWRPLTPELAERIIAAIEELKDGGAGRD